MYQEKTMCFTGHRPQKLGGFDPNNPIMRDVRAKLHDVLRRAYTAGYTRFISGGALGVDQCVAELVEEMKANGYPVKSVIAVPFESQDAVWPDSSKKHYRDLLRGADEVVVVSTGTYTAAKMQIRNEWMVSHSDCTVAIWDGTSGGTANCVRFAHSCARPILRVHPTRDEENWINGCEF